MLAVDFPAGDVALYGEYVYWPRFDRTMTVVKPGPGGAGQGTATEEVVRGSGALARTSRSLLGVAPEIVHGGIDIGSLALDGPTAFWTLAGPTLGDAFGSLVTCDLPACATQRVVATNLELQGTVMAVDATSVYLATTRLTAIERATGVKRDLSDLPIFGGVFLAGDSVCWRSLDGIYVSPVSGGPAQAVLHQPAGFAAGDDFNCDSEFLYYCALDGTHRIAWRAGDAASSSVGPDELISAHTCTSITVVGDALWLASSANGRSAYVRMAKDGTHPEVHYTERDQLGRPAIGDDGIYFNSNAAILRLAY